MLCCGRLETSDQNFICGNKRSEKQGHFLMSLHTIRKDFLKPADSPSAGLLVQCRLVVCVCLCVFQREREPAVLCLGRPAILTAFGNKAPT